MSGHTPGRWFCGRALRGGQECVIGDGDSVVCFMPDSTIGCTFIRDNARLIAAAPRLLEALQSIVASLAEHDDEGMIEHAEQMIAARTAIAAATGETL